MVYIMEENNGISSKVIIQAIAVLAVLLIAIYLYSSTMKPETTESVSTPEFAECISDSGAVFYGTTWCSHCNSQKALFGSTIDKIEFVDCDLSRELCSLAGVSAYPTWVINGEKHIGTQPLEELADLTGCTLNV